MTKSILTRTPHVIVGLVALLVCGAAQAHGIAGDDQAFFLRAMGAHIGPYVYLGAKHMVTGYDHLLFLAGVIFFLYRAQRCRALRDAVCCRAQHDAVARRARRLACRCLSRRRRDRFVGRLQGVREPRRISPARRAAEYPGRRAVFWLFPRLGARNEAAGSRALARRARSPTWSRSTSASRSGSCLRSA